VPFEFVNIEHESFEHITQTAEL